MSRIDPNNVVVLVRDSSDAIVRIGVSSWQELRVVSRVPWKSSGVASAELGYLSRLRVVKPERRGVIAFREAA